MRFIKFQWIIGFVALLVLLAGCQLLLFQPDDSSLQLSLVGSGNPARSFGPGISVDVHHYVIRGESASGQTFEETTPENQIVVPNLTPGYWDITVDAFNESDVRLYTGSARVLVTARNPIAVSISLVAVPGTGTFSIDVSWPEGEVLSPVIDASLVPTVGDPVPLTFDIVGSAASFSSDEVPSGYHTLVLKVKEETMIVAGAVEFVQVISGYTTEANIHFDRVNAPGSLEIGAEVAPDFSESLLVTVAGGETLADFGVPVALQGTVEGTSENTVFSWYVNGTAVDSGTSQIEISGDVPGYFRVDLIVVTADGGEGGMATTWVEIAEPGA